MPKWGEVKARWAWLNENLSDDEPVLFKLPRREARKRIANLEKKRRITMQTDEQNYSEWHAIREAWMQELNENPTLFVHAAIEAMRTFDIRSWLEQQNGPGESLENA